MLPLQHAIRALVEEGLLPTELDNHYRLKQIGVCGWLQSRGIELRGQPPASTAAIPASILARCAAPAATMPVPFESPPLTILEALQLNVTMNNHNQGVTPASFMVRITSRPATTPSTPSKMPPAGTESRCEAMTMAGYRPPPRNSNHRVCLKSGR